MQWKSFCVSKCRAGFTTAANVQLHDSSTTGSHSISDWFVYITLERLLLRISFVFLQMLKCLRCHRPGLSLLERCHVIVFAGRREKTGTKKAAILAILVL